YDAFSATRIFGGFMDEIRISSVVRSSNWLWAVWYNMASNDQFNCFGRIVDVSTPNLELDKTVDLNAISTETNLTYTLTVCNSGFGPMDDIRVTDTLPVGTVFLSSTPAPTNIVDNDYLFELGPLVAGELANIQINVALTGEVPHILTNSAVTGSSTAESNLLDNTATALTVVRRSELALTKSVDQTLIQSINSNLVYTLTVTNRGPAAATNVVVTDTLPSNITLGVSTPPEDSFTNGVLTFNLGVLPAGAQTSITIQASADTSATQSFLNTAGVTSDNPEFAVSDNTNSALTAVLDYEFGMKLFFCGYERTETLSNFPVLVVLGTNRTGFSYRDVASPEGYDLRFSNLEQTEILPYEIESWDTNGLSYIWVQLPELAPTTTVIWAYWGAATMGREAYTTNGAVWSEAFEAVWHMNETAVDGGNVAGLHLDATANNQDGDQVGNVSVAGFVGTGQDFDGTNDYIAIPGTIATTSLTISAWLNIDLLDSWDPLINADGFTAGDVHLQYPPGATGLRYSIGSAGDNNFPYAIVSGQWQRVTSVYDGINDSLVVYVNGEAIGSVAAVGNAQLLSPTPGRIAGWDGGGRLFDGQLDEFRIAGTALSSNWIWATWYNMASNDQFTCYSPAIARDEANLELSKSVDLNSVTTETGLVYTLTVCNSGLATLAPEVPTRGRWCSREGVSAMTYWDLAMPRTG
ncbi:MAG: DUF2341 domain-containing protein, partial [Verrucomicrobiota bacterium]